MTRASIFWHQGRVTFSYRFLRINRAVRSSSFCMIADGLAPAVGQMSAWKCSGMKTYPTILNPNSRRRFPKVTTH